MFISPKRATRTILVCSAITITALLLSLTQWRALSAGAAALLPNAVSRVTESAYAAPIAHLPNLVSVTIWEDTRILSTDPLNEVTFSIADNRLSSRLATLDASNHDFAVFRGGGYFDEYYDFFFSNADGTPNPEGEFLTTEVRHNNSSTGGNISEVTLNFLDGRKVNANSVASFVVLGPGDANTVSHAVDGDLNTTTLLGNTLAPDQRLRLTVGFPSIVNNSVTCSPAGFGFSPTASPVTGSDPISIAVGDFNGDGKQDLAVANQMSHNVTILKGDGTGGFGLFPGLPVTIGVGNQPFSLVVGDFNGDGKQDLATANLGSSNVTILLGDGSGGFSPAPSSPISVGAGSDPISIAVGDFNLDGKQDLAVARQAANVMILMGDGGGGFSQATFDAGSVPDAVAVGDFNGDGKQDLAVANQGSNDVTILLGNGSGGFSPAPGLPASVGSIPRSIAVGDFNGDGKQDLVTTNQNTNDVTILKGDGTGGFGPFPGLPAAVGVGTGPRYVVVGDFNGDGKQDLAVTNHNTSDATILLGDGSGGFSPASASPIGALNLPYPVAVGDFNSDGKQDLAIGRLGSDNVLILLNNCAPMITAAGPVTRTAGSLSANSTIANVNDAEDAENTLTVTVNSSSTATVNGITVSGLSVDSAGVVTANVVAACGAANASFTLMVTDSGGLSTNATLNVTVNANTPTLSYANYTIPPGSTWLVRPTTGPGSISAISSVTVQSQGTYTGGIAVTSNTTGFVEFTNAAPAGMHTITIRATDICGSFTDATFNIFVVPCVSTLTVNNLGDGSDATPGNGVCETAPGNGVCTLRAAIEESNAMEACSPLTINFSVTGTINLATALPYVRHHNLTINGPGPSQLNVRRNGASNYSIFIIINLDFPLQVTTISGLTISNGDVAATGGVGGGIYNYGGSLTLNNCVLTGNKAREGGAFYSSSLPGTLMTITNCAITGNTADVLGGGISYDSGQMTITGSTISGNIAHQYGGGVAATSTALGLTMTNCTVSGNTAFGTQRGGGIYHSSGLSNANLILTNCTIANNTGSVTGGGGIHNNGAGATVTYKNTIVANNTGPNFVNVGGTLNSLGNNLSSDGTGNLVAANDQPNTDPMLGPLANNSGPTQTIALLPGSPAIDKGSAASGVTTDQRGLTRPLDLPSIANATGGDGSDIGAFETQTPPNTPPTITAVSPLMRQQGSAATNLQIATVSDADQTANTLTVTAALATGAGVTMSNITINAGGQVFADVVAICAATSSMFALTVSDNQSATATRPLTVNLTSNMPPTLTYTNQSVVAGGLLTINPTTGPSDNGSVNSIAVQSQDTYTGTISVNSSGGVSISNAKPAGTHTITIRATDNCGGIGGTTDASFTLTVNCPVITINPSTLPAGLTGVPYNQSLSTTGGSSAVIYSLNNGSVLPSWLTLSAAGVLSGTPPQAGNAAFTIKATDSNGCTGLRSYALSWAFVVGGTPVTTVGQAQLSLGSDGSVIVSGLNNPGLNGYTLRLGQATGAGVTLQPASDLRPNGNSMAMQTRGQVNGLTEQVIATSSFKGNGVNVIYTEDFSGIGSTQSLFQFYDATGNLLRAFTAPNLSQLTFNTGGSPYTATAKTYFESRSNTTKASLNAPVSVIGPANITTPNVTEISVTALHPTATVSHVSSATVLCHMNQGTLAASHPTVGVFGLPFESAHPRLPGETQTATLSAGIGSLTVANISSTGNDGVMLNMDVRGLGGTGGAHYVLEPATTMANIIASPAGAFMQASITGSLNGTPNQSLGRLKTMKNLTPLININSTQSKTRQSLIAPMSITSEIYTVTADFGAIPSTTHRVQVYNNGALVADISGHTGTVGTTSAWPLSFAQRVVPTGGNPLVGLPGFITTYPASTGINISGNNYVGNELRVTAEGSGVTINNLTAFKLTAADIPEFTIVDARIIPVNNAPTISAVAVTRQAGSPAANTTIANVNDIEDAENILNLKVNNAASATVNGVTVSGLSVNSAGAVMANVVAACGATNASFALTVTDSGGTPISTGFDVNVTANTPPSLVYPTSVTVSNGVNGVGQTISPTVRSDNGTITSFTLLSDLQPGDLSVNQATGVVKVEKLLQPGPHPVTVTATDNCGAIRVFTFLLIVNRPPSINGTLTTRQKGSLPSLSVIAVVSDAEDAANTLNLKVNNAASATVNGITVSGLSVDSAGIVRANVVAACISSTAIFTLLVTDSSGLSSSASLTVGVSPNTPPILGTYLSTTISLLTGTPSVQVTPIGLPPSDNGTISNMTVAAPGVPGNNLSVNPTTGVVTITKAGTPSGTHTVTVRAIDNCGAMTTRLFQLIVKF